MSQVRGNGQALQEHPDRHRTYGKDESTAAEGLLFALLLQWHRRCGFLLLLLAM